jgi:acetyl esterase
LSSPLHPTLQAFVDATPAEDDAAPDLATRRVQHTRFAEEVGGPPQPVAQARDLELPGPTGALRARWYVPAEAEAEAEGGRPGVFVYLHGGGWSLGDLDGFDRVCRALANASGAGVLSVDYRLAPEHPFPAAVQDAEAALRWVAAEAQGVLGADSDRLAIGGDSAGANLAAVVARRARDAAGPPLRAQVLVYPVTDLRMASASYSEFADNPLLDRARMEVHREEYLAGADPADPDASPLLAENLRGLPPALVVTAGHDVLRDDGASYAARLQEAGVSVTHVHYADMAHGFIRWGGVLEAARDLHARMGAAVRAALVPQGV